MKRNALLLILLVLALLAGLYAYWQRIPEDEIGATVLMFPADYSGSKFFLEGSHLGPEVEAFRREVTYGGDGAQTSAWQAVKADTDGAFRVVVKIGERKVTNYTVGLIDNSPERLKLTFVRVDEPSQSP